MRKVIATALAMISISICQAQETEVIYSDNNRRDVETLMKSDGGFGGHLSLNMKGTEVYNDAAIMVGGELVFTLNHALNIGVAGYGMPTRVDYQSDFAYEDDQYLEMGYGGLFIEPVFFDQKVVHFTVPVLIGGGWSGISYFDPFNEPQINPEDYITDQSVFFVLEPGINMEVNLVRHVKLTLGGSYRYVNGSDIARVSDDDLSGLTFGAGIRVGWF